CADGRARVFAGRLLLDADRGRQAGQQIDVRLLQLAEKLAGGGGERFDVAALSLRIERGEGKRNFSGGRDGGENDQVVARQIEIDVLQIMFAGASDDNGLVIHRAEVSGKMGRNPVSIQKATAEIVGLMADET